jgi:hypothetical protein
MEMQERYFYADDRKEVIEQVPYFPVNILFYIIFTNNN